MRPELYRGAATAALLLTAGAAAAQTTSPTTDDSTLLSDVIVTANRSAQAADRVGQSVTVLTTQQIEASQTVEVVDLLVRTPGVSLSRNGGIGTTTALRIRGAEADQTVYVIDGVKLNDPSSTGSGYNPGNLLTGDIARIEILRGAQSTLWGSQAIGGVVNLITAEPTRPFQAALDAEVGSRGTSYLRGGLAGVGERINWRLAASHYQTDGFSTFARGTEKDGYENTGLSGRVNIKLTEDVSIDLRSVWSSGRTDIDGFPAPTYSFGDTREYGTTKDLVAYAGLNFDLFEDRLKNRVAYAYTQTDRQNFNPAQAVTNLTFDARGENRRFEYQGVFDIVQGWVATFGAEHEDSEFRTASPSEFTPSPTPTANSVGLDGYYLQVQGEVVDGLTLTGGVRRDEHDTFGGKTLGQAAVAWSLNDGGTVLRASFGQGFKAPSLYQLYSEYGNTTLQPEEADGWDAGVEQHFLDKKLMVSATYFSRDTTNQIDYVSCSSTVTQAAAPLCFVNNVRRFGYYSNTAKTQANGVELAAAAWVGPVEVQANYTFTDATNETAGANLGKHLARRPEETANLSATYVWPFRLTTTVAVQYAGESFNNASNSVRLEPYTLVDLRASYPINDTVEIYGRVENVGDEQYQTTTDYGSAGRGTFVGVRARF
ncbi:TonB-dependent receptor plug domain-containing protein [Brevundimonas goettingensis]|uniref:TonB-dependent receptor n=1 Tax=Brevundimonas goettingensis TaxID=2774190 RepID=A0A975BYK8_9CAUL|nr:TonB-dependent receptor [Brevundimonas goettingensis]QTC89968.1 TonB-dependent receptor [Brevundimonas goettingensis]